MDQSRTPLVLHPGQGGAKEAATASRTYDVVIPTVGRPSLARLLESLAAAGAGDPQERLGRIILADDRREPLGPLTDHTVALPSLADRTVAVRSGGKGPAAARNAGWQASRSEWVAFLDDDVVVPTGWFDDLGSDLEDVPPDVAASQGCLRVPLPKDRPPTDWERNVAGLEQAQWATADMCFRRSVLVALGGFDERFPRAYREDAELGLRCLAAGYRIVRGRRHVQHPIRPADRWVSLRLQAGNADDALMRALHGRRWRRTAGVPRGRRPFHVAVTLAALAGLTGLALRRPTLATLGLVAWLGGTVEFMAARMRPGPRDREELATVALTSIAIPPVAVIQWLSGVLRAAVLVRRPWNAAFLEPRT